MDSDATGLPAAERDAFIRTVLTEASSNDPMGWAAVAGVIRNRLQTGKYGNSITRIVQAPNQFEVWSNGRAQAVDPKSPQYEAAGRIVDAVAGGLPDVTGGSTHFYSPSGQAALGRAPPRWGGAGGTDIGGNRFYAPQGAVQPQAPAAAVIDQAAPPVAPSQPQGQPVAEDPLAVLKRYGVDGSSTAPAASQARAQPKLDVGYAPAQDPLAVLSRYGVKVGTDTPPARAPNGGAPADVVNRPTDRKDPIYHGAVPVGDAPPDQSATTAFAAGVGGVPIVGPALLGGVQRAAAAARAVTSDSRYSDELRSVQEMTDLAQRQHPIAATAGNATGAILGSAPLVSAAPAAFGISNAPLLLRGLSGAGTSGAIGAGDAAVRGENPLLGGATGGAIGFVAPGAGAALGKGIGALSALRGSGVDGVGRPAVNLLTQAITADTPQLVQAEASRLGPAAAVPDLGPSLGGLAQGLAVKPGDAKSALFRMLEDRASGANGRISTDLNALLGPAEDPQAVTNAIRATRAATDAANYAQVHGAGVEVDPSSVVAAIDGRLPTATGAQRSALQNLRRELVVRDEVPATETTTAQPAQYRTNSEFLHNLRQEIDAAMEQGAPGLGVPAGALQRAQGTLGMVRSTLDRALKDQLPGMREADAASAALARRGEAVERGTQTLGAGKSTTTPEAFAQQYEGMEPGERVALNKGLRGEINRLVGTKSNDPAALRLALQGEGGWNTAKLGTAFGEQPANALVDAVAREGRFGETMNRVVGNSQTAARQGAAGLLKDTDTEATNLLPTTAAGFFLHYGKKAFYDPAMRYLLTPNNVPRDQQLGRVLSLQGDERDRVINQLIAASVGSGRAASASRGADALGTAGTNLLLQEYAKRNDARQAPAR